MGWLAGWKYRKRYQILVPDLNQYSPGPFKVDVEYLEGKMNPDMSDVRFTLADGTTLLDIMFIGRRNYYNDIQAATGYPGGTCMLAPSGSPYAVFYMYYGRGSATIPPICARGLQEFCDDFNDNSIDTVKWYATAGVVEETVAEANLAEVGQIKIEPTAKLRHLASNSSFAKGQLLNMKVKFDGDSNGRTYVGLTSTDADSEFWGRKYCALTYHGLTGFEICIHIVSELHQHTVAQNLSLGEWISLSIHWKTDGSFGIEINGIKEDVQTSLVIEDDMRVGLGNVHAIYMPTYYLYMDYASINPVGDAFADEVPEGSAEVSFDAYSQCVRLNQYLYEVKHTFDYSQKTAKLPDKLIKKWIRKDIAETTLRLGGILNQRYRKIAVISAPEALGVAIAGVAHIAESTDVTGLTGLVVNEYAKCAIMYIANGQNYQVGISSNTATSLVIVDGKSLPEITDGTIWITKDTAGGTVSLLPLRAFENGDSIWHVRGIDGKPIPKIQVELSKNIQNLST